MKGIGTIDADYTLKATNARGLTLLVDGRDERGRHMAARAANLNPVTLAMWEQLLALHLWELIVDVGANYGEMLLGSPLNDVEIVAYEPNPHIAAYLSVNVDRAQLRCDIRQRALSDRAGTSTFLTDTTWSGTSRLVQSPEDPALADPRFEQVSCPISTIDLDFSKAGVASACLKIDTEGEELRILEGGRNWLAGIPTLGILMEVVHLPDGQLAQLTEDYCFYLRHLATGRLVRVASASPGRLRSLLDSGSFYVQDAILTNRPISGLGGASGGESATDHVEEATALAGVVADLEAYIHTLHAQAEVSASRLDAQQAALEGLLGSRSWRLTAGLRRASPRRWRMSRWGASGDGP